MDTDICELCMRDNPGLHWTLGGVTITVGVLCRIVQKLRPDTPGFKWALVSKALGISKTATSASSMLRRKYEKYILPYEIAVTHRKVQQKAIEDTGTLYINQQKMNIQLSVKLASLALQRTIGDAQNMLHLQLLRSSGHPIAKKPQTEGNQISTGADIPAEGRVLVLYNEGKPVTDTTLDNLLKRADGVMSLTLGPLRYISTVPPFYLLYQVLEELILYDIPSNLLEAIYDMAVEQLPRLRLLHLINTAYSPCSYQEDCTSKPLASLEISVEVPIG